jgi:hypothetical protein
MNHTDTQPQSKIESTARAGLRLFHSRPNGFGQCKREEYVANAPRTNAAAKVARFENGAMLHW